jgi:hypothetical protein
MMTTEQERLWATLQDNYAVQAHIMLDDMYKNDKIDYHKADKHFEYIMDNWPDMEVFRATKTWLASCPLDTRKLNTFSRFTEIYADIILKNKKQYVLYEKHNLSPNSLTKTK